jgi:hypothetical protein
MNLKPLLALSLCCFLKTTAQDISPAYRIRATVTPFKSGYLYLAHHYGSKQYLVDSARIGTNSEAVFSGKERLFGGIYMIVFPLKNNWLECIVDQDQDFQVFADSANLIRSVRFSGSADNDLFATYQKKSFDLGTDLASMQQKLNGAKPEEAEKIRAEMQVKSSQLQAYRESFLRAHPDNLLSAIFRTLREPTVPPAASHPGGKYDSSFAYQYYKQHYWDGVSFKDERLVRTPVFQPKLDRYFTQVLPQDPDSIIEAADQILQQAANAPEMHKFVLANLTDKYVNPQFMGQDKVFVHLFEKYYLTGKADSWMSDKYRKFIFDRGYSLIANVIGTQGANFEWVDTLGKRGSLYQVSSAFTVLCFWDPTCSHCQEELPRLDSMYQAAWKNKGVKLVGVMTEGGRDNWLNFIHKHNLKDWLHVHQTQEMKDADYAAGKPGYRQLYDVYQTPMLYLLDQDKRIVAKRLSYQQLNDLLQIKWQGSALK